MSDAAMDALAQEWHTTQNGPLQFGELSYGSGKKVWWRGRCGHEWQAEYRSRTTKGAGCPVCTGRLIISGINDLATVHPEIASEWHPIKNEEARPDHCARTSSKAVWWLGKCGHEWKSSISGRTSMGSGCPYCASRTLLVGFNDLKTRFPEVAKEWHQSRNGDIHPESLSPGSTKSVWWICHLNHEWTARIVDRSHGANGCPVCSGKRVVPGSNDLQTTHTDAAYRWHPTKNGLLTPRDVTAGSNRKCWWLGPCGHEWEAAVNKMTSGRGCPVCRGLQVLAGFNDLASRNPKAATEWHPTKNGILLPEKVTYGSMRKVWWSGPCGHEWEATITLRANAGTGCPFCRGLQIAVGDNDLASQFPELAAEWHPTKNGTLQPTGFTPGANVKVWWLGKCGHEWKALISSRTGVGSGCPQCVGRISKPELALFEHLAEAIGDLRLNVVMHVPWGSIRQRQRARCDMASEELGIVVEYDGWFYHRNKLADDVAKTRALIKAGWFVIRVRASGNNPQNCLPQMPVIPGLATAQTQHSVGGKANAEMVFDLIKELEITKVSSD